MRKISIYFFFPPLTHQQPQTSNVYSAGRKYLPKEEYKVKTDGDGDKGGDLWSVVEVSGYHRQFKGSLERVG